MKDNYQIFSDGLKCESILIFYHQSKSGFDASYFGTIKEEA